MVAERLIPGLPTIEKPLPEPRFNLESPREVSTEAGHRLVPVLVWLGVILTLVLLPLKIISYGYLPGDDALRHAAKAVSGRDWSDILVLQDQFKMDHNPGWHWILGAIHRLTGADTDALLTLSLCTLPLIFLGVPLRFVRRPEAWAAALLAGVVAFAELFYRLFLARPFVLSMTVTVSVLFLWRNVAVPSKRLLGATALLFALATWVHGSWYLFALVVLAFALAGHQRQAFQLGGCWIAGSLLGALLTGHPFGFLLNAVRIGINCFGQHTLQRMLVTEFSPSDGALPAVLLVSALLLARLAIGDGISRCFKDPVFMLVLLAWVLGFRVVRFWGDWGIPALALWVALEFERYFSRYVGAQSFRRLILTAGVCAALFFGVTSDLRGRWTWNLTNEYLSENDPEMRPWLPEEGGILYSSDMRVFYQTFYKNPHARWKYMLAFEATFMPPEDLAILRRIQWNYGAHKSYQPWVARMRPQDRMVLFSNSTTAPAIEGLEWKYVAREIWVGRLPRPGSGT